MTAEMQPLIQIAQYKIDPNTNMICGPDGDVHAEPKVIALAMEFGAHPYEVLSRDHLITTLWDGAYGADQSLSVTVSRLRKHLQDKDKQNRLIETVPKRGYRLASDVVLLDAMETRHSGNGKNNIPTNNWFSLIHSREQQKDKSTNRKTTPTMWKLIFILAVIVGLILIFLPNGTIKTIFAAKKFPNTTILLAENKTLPSDFRKLNFRYSSAFHQDRKSQSP